MSSFLERIRAGVKNTTTVIFPGSDQEVTMRIASRDEIMEANFATEAIFARRKIGVQAHNLLSFEAESTLQVLFRVLTDSEGKPLAPTVDRFRALVSDKDIDELANMYKAFESEVSPSVESMDTEQIKEFIADLKKKPEKMIGCVSSLPFARKLISSLVQLSD